MEVKQEKKLLQKIITMVIILAMAIGIVFFATGCSEEDVEGYKTKIEQLENQLASKDAEISELQEKVAELEAEIEDLEMDSEVLAQKYETLKAYMDDAKSDVDGYIEAGEITTSEYEAIVVTIEELMTLVGKFKANLWIPSEDVAMVEEWISYITAGMEEIEKFADVAYYKAVVLNAFEAFFTEENEYIKIAPIYDDEVFMAWASDNFVNYSITTMNFGRNEENHIMTGYAMMIIDGDTLYMSYEDLDYDFDSDEETRIPVEESFSISEQGINYYSREAQISLVLETLSFVYNYSYSDSYPDNYYDTVDMTVLSEDGDNYTIKFSCSEKGWDGNSYDGIIEIYEITFVIENSVITKMIEVIGYYNHDQWEEYSFITVLEIITESEYNELYNKTAEFFTILED